MAALKLVALCVLMVTVAAVEQQQTQFVSPKRAPLEWASKETLAFLDKIWSKMASSNSLKCTACKATTDVFLRMAFSNVSTHLIQDFAIKICEKGQPHEVCVGVISEFTPWVLDAVKRAYLNEEDICGFLRACPYTPPTQQSMKAWMEGVLAKTPSKPYSPPAKSGEVGKFVQFSDIHMDTQYKVGTKTDCGYPLCCREVFGAGTAARWGDYNCDANAELVQSAMTFAKSLQPDFVLWTGDNPPHDVWEQTIETNLAYSKAVTDLVSAAFGDIPVYPALGNHGPAPVDEFDPEKDVQLLNGLADMWSHWLPAEAQETFRKWGYYSVKHSDKLRILCLNTQFGDNENFYLFYAPNDPGNMWQYMWDQLLEAEANDERVIVIGHIPTFDATVDFGVRFQALADRFRHVISTTVFGHAHHEEWGVLHGVHDKQDVTVTQFVSTSITPNGNVNPSFRVFTYDKASYEHLDLLQYYTDLADANAHADRGPVWQLAYSSLSEYNMTDMSPQSWWDLNARMAADDSVFARWFFHNRAQNPAAGALHPESCVDGCRKDIFCTVTTSYYDEYVDCMQPYVDSGALSNELFERFANWKKWSDMPN